MNRPKLNNEYSIYYLTWIRSNPLFRVLKIMRSGNIDFVERSNQNNVIKFRHGLGSNPASDYYIIMFNKWMENNHPEIDMTKKALKPSKKKTFQSDKNQLRKVQEWKQYSEYLLSDQWKKKSDDCKRKSNFKCECCLSSGELNSHHYNYVMLYNERDSDLFCLCNNCHYMYHTKTTKLPSDVNFTRESRLRHIISQIKS